MFKRLAGVAVVLALAGEAGAQTPAEAPPPVADYGRLPAIELVDLSPSGDQVALVAVEGETRSLLVVSPKTKTLVARSRLGDTKVRDVTFVGEEMVMVTVSGTFDLGPSYASRYELAQVALLDLRTTEITWVFARGSTSMMRAVFDTYGVFEEDGRKVGYFSGYETDPLSGGLVRPHPDVWRVDLETGRHRRALLGDDDDPDYVMAAGGEVLVSSEYDEESRRWVIYRGRDRKAVLAEGTSEVGGTLLAGLGRTPDTFVWWRRGENGDAELVEQPVGGGEPVRLGNPSKRVAGPLRDRATRLLQGVRYAGPRPDLEWFDRVKRARFAATVKAFPPEQRVTLAAADDAFEELIVFVEGAEEAGAYWYVDIKAGDAGPMGSTYPAVKPHHVGEARLVRYKAADGLELEGVLTLPPGREAKNLPVVVLPHGGPEAHDSLGFDWWAQAYASRGYAVWQPNFRGSSGYGEALVEAGYGEWGRKMQTDVSDGTAELARQGIVDPKRACVVGASYGGYAALAGVTVQNGLYRCAVAVAGVSDLRAMLYDERRQHGRQSDTVRYWTRFMGAKSPGDPVLKTLSPAELAAQADAPVLLIHGKDDTVVPLDQSRIMERALKRAGKPVEFVLLDGEDHWLSRGATRQAMLEAAVAFVEKHVPAD